MLVARKRSDVFWTSTPSCHPAGSLHCTPCQPPAPTVNGCSTVMHWEVFRYADTGYGYPDSRQLSTHCEIMSPIAPFFKSHGDITRFARCGLLGQCLAPGGSYVSFRLMKPVKGSGLRPAEPDHQRPDPTGTDDRQPPGPSVSAVGATTKSAAVRSRWHGPSTVRRTPSQYGRG